jgi:hypothetical protein
MKREFSRRDFFRGSGALVVSFRRHVGLPGGKGRSARIRRMLIRQGTSRALGEEITWDDRKVTSIDWQTYKMLSLGIQVPLIESVLINRPGTEATGAGETAISNAIFDATGARVRQVPFTPDRVKAAIAARR